MEGLPKSDNSLRKKPHQRLLTPDTPSATDSFSLADVTPEQALNLLALPLMQWTPPAGEGLGLSHLRQALERKRDRLPLLGVDADALELAGEIVHSAMPEHAAGGALYRAEELRAHIDEFVQAALKYTVARGPLLA